MMADARDQARLLLVSLLENFCQLYNPSDNQLLFQILCEKLSLMGIIREEDFDEHFSAVRGVYKLAFKELVTQALVAVRTARDSAQQRISPQSSLLLEYLPDGASGNGGGADEDATVESDEDVDDVRSSSESSGPMAFLLDNASTPRNATPAPLLSGSLAVTSVMAPVPSTSPQSSSITATRGVTPETIVDLLDLHTSRYATDFTEIRRLGRGGFGSVFHVRNKLDGREYAVKKVTLSDPKDLHRVLREVKVLARMDHPNIVRYHSAWLEYEDRRLPGTRPGAGPSSSSSMQSQDSDASFGTDGASATDDSTTGEGVGVTFTREEEDSWANRTSKGAAADGDSDAADAAASRSRSREKKPTRPSPRNERSLPPVNPARPLTLKIQMELCYSSLHDWLMHRNTLRHLKPWMLMAEANFLFRSLLCGLEYVQERGTSHRDLTPRNMFLVRKEHQIQHRAIQRRKSAASSSSSSGSSSRSRKISGESVFSDLDADEAALPLCQWLNVETLDDVGIKIGDFGLVSEHGRPGASSSSYSSPSISPLPRTGSGVSIGFGRLPEPSVLLGQPSRGSPVSASDKEDAESVTLTAATAAPLPRGGKAPPPPPLPLAKLRPAAAARSTPPGSEAGSPISPRFPPYQSPVNGMPSLNSNMSTPTNNGVVAPPVPLRPIPRLPSFAPTIGIGTATYSAPEQIARSGKYAWHRVTSDMYSLGVVLLELLCPFATGMERFVTLERLRAIHDCDRRLPPDLITTFPGHAAMILWLTAEDPTQRPSPGEMLTVFPPPVPDALVKHAPSDLQKTPLYEESYEFVPDPGSLPPESPLPLPKLTSASLAGAGGDRERLEHLARTVRQQQAIIESKDQEIALLRAKLASVLGGSVN
ncbi:kinase-like domain-containing protein [Blastocladiella britannica]|nr:kinase-like domain-containing protein [Blastocladiella britannica]